MSEEKDFTKHSEENQQPAIDRSSQAPENASSTPEENETLSDEATQPDSLNPEPQTIENMEVHHHGHVHEKKKWKEYVFQFFMLFLAVFCGFLAEYQLEHVVENNREKQFMSSFVRDLELDTIQLDLIRDLRHSNIQRIDSSMIFFTSSDNINALPYKTFQHMRLGLRTFYQNSGTLDQLKNAGGLRLVRKRKIVDSILAYDQAIKRMVLRDASETNIVFDNSKIVEKMVNGRAMIKIYADSVIHNKQPNPGTLINLKPEYLDEYLNSLTFCRGAYQANLNLQRSIKRRAANLIQLIKREYHLEDE